MRAELARDTVEGAVGRLIPLQLSWFVKIGVLKRAVPGAFEHLESLFDDKGTFTFRLTLFKRKNAVFHLFLRGISGETKPHRFTEIFFIVGDKVEGDLASRQNVLRRIGIVAAFQQHCIAILACDVVGETQRIGSEIGPAFTVQSSDKYGRHREK